MPENKIEWCTHTSNPFTGCNHGCGFCYARRMASRWSYNTRTTYHRVAYEYGDPFVPTVHLELFAKLDRALTGARKARDVFLGSMSDMCCDVAWSVMNNGIVQCETRSTEWLQRKIQNLARRHPRHTFLILTKAPKNLITGWPKNVRLGVSITHSDDSCDMRLIRFRLDHPAIFRWVSVEPLLDPGFDPRMLGTMNWVVVGAQTGAGAPVLHAEHKLVLSAKAIVEYCQRLNVPCFVKSNMRKADPGYPWPKQIPAGCALAA